MDGLLSWGNYPKAHQSSITIEDARAPLPNPQGKMLPRGNGRSYGDSCLVPGGTLLRSQKLDKFLDFDPSTGLLRCQAGVLLDDVIRTTLPYGWFVPVTPGTRFVSVGGAIANDVHGKNHHVAGSFGNHVKSLELLRSDGNRLALDEEQGGGIFSATIGGLGLTGFITEATMQLKRVPGPWLYSESIRFENLDQFFLLSNESAITHEYSVAWIDCLAKGKQLGRGHFIRADHAPAPPGYPAPRARKKVVPFTPPFSMINGATLRPFNWLYYHRQLRKRKGSFIHFLPYFYPLDAIRNWNRIYGANGFLQYQCVLPPSSARDGIAEILRQISASGRGSFLAVLKEFGDVPSRGVLSFPRKGTTLALDFANSGEGPFKLFKRIDQVVAEAGGAIYPAKDAAMSRMMFERGFPNWERIVPFLDPRMESGFWRRVGMT